MSRFDSISKQDGVSLVEVLVAVVVFAIGLLAIASLQGTLVRTGNDAKSRTVAVNLADQKLEDIRSFVDGTEFQNATGGSETFIGEDDDNDGFGAVSGVNMVREWTVQDYHYEPDDTSNEMVLASGTNSSGNADAKRVTVTVAWCDGDSAAGCDPADDTTDRETVSVTDIVSKAEPAGSARAVTELNVGEPPEIPYTPGDAPEVISIDLEDGTKKESPEPVIQTTRKQNEDEEDTDFSSLTRFDAITFIPPPAGEEGVTVRRLEFLTVNCTCQQAGLPTDGDRDSYGRTPVFWDGEQYIGGTKARKPIGVSTIDQADESEIAFIQPLCSDCCRDHHDAPSGTTFDHDGDPDTDEIAVAQYDPFREDGVTGSGDHHHYFPNNQDVLELADGEGAQYLEACRFVRVDGQLKLTTDFRMESFQVMPGKECGVYTDGAQACDESGTITDLSGGDSGWIETYRDYVTAFVEEFATEASDGTANYPSERPTINSTTAQPSNLPTTDTVPPDGGAHELVSRAVFIDFLHPVLRQRIVDQIAANNDANGDNDQPILTLVPFFEVNLQLQANWSVDNGNLVEVTSAPVDNDGYSRGFVTENEELGGETDVFATIEQGNAGLTDTHDIFPTDLDGSGTVDADELLQDSLAYGFADAPDRPIVTGRIIPDPSLTGNNRLDPSDIILTDGFGNSCSVPAGEEVYECEMDPSNSSGEIVVTGYNKLKNNGTLIENNKVCMKVGANTFIEGSVTNDNTGADTTTFVFPGEGTPIDRTGYDIYILTQSGGSITCSPGQVP